VEWRTGPFTPRCANPSDRHSPGVVHATPAFAILDRE
jgi:hypothetical protein